MEHIEVGCLHPVNSAKPVTLIVHMTNKKPDTYTRQDYRRYEEALFDWQQEFVQLNQNLETLAVLHQLTEVYTQKD